jgi:chemosensory pili system protein ChpA (sensor histidine kinase/response regulator)
LALTADAPADLPGEPRTTSETAYVPTPDTGEEAIDLAPQPDETRALDDGDDSGILLDIFVTEASAHLDVIESVLAQPEAELSDELQRALHTLKGSAHMAEVFGVAQVVTPVERLVKELRAAQLPADPDVIDVLARSVGVVRTLLSDPAAARAPMEGAEDFALAVVQATEFRPPPSPVSSAMPSN